MTSGGSCIPRPIAGKAQSKCGPNDSATLPGHTIRCSTASRALLLAVLSQYEVRCYLGFVAHSGRWRIDQQNACAD
jgi:hypothetical protein